MRYGLQSCTLGFIILSKLRRGLFNFYALLHEVETKIKSLELSINSLQAKL